MNFTTQDLHQLCNGLPGKKNIRFSSIISLLLKFKSGSWMMQKTSLF